MDEIYLAQSIPQTDWQIIIEGDEHSIWAYIARSSENAVEIEFDGFICSRGTLLEKNNEVQEYLENGCAPPLTKEFANEFSIQNNVEAKDLQVRYGNNKVSIGIEEIVFLVMDLDKKQSFSKSINKVGPYGIPLEN